VLVFGGGGGVVMEKQATIENEQTRSRSVVVEVW